MPKIIKESKIENVIHTPSIFPPTRLWQNFLRVCEIPHPSTKEAALISYIQRQAQIHGLRSSIDPAGNLIVCKPAHSAHEDRPSLILQAHVDMVPQANNDVQFDFDRDAIQPYVENGWVKASGTTLGADNGIAVAAMLTIIEDCSLEHGNLELLFTVKEEIGLLGAKALQPNTLKGNILINLDNEDIGDIAIGCAGGRDAIANTQIAKQKLPTTTQAIVIGVSGLKGGHSGCDIHLGRGNAIHIMARILGAIMTDCPSMQLNTINGGNASNAIPREANATIAVSIDDYQMALKALDAASEIIKKEYVTSDSGIKITSKDGTQVTTAFPPSDSQRLIKAILAAHNGIARMSDTLEKTPETSANLGIITTSGGTVSMTHKVRSSLDTDRDSLCQKITDNYKKSGFSTELSCAYPGWSPAPDSKVAKILKSVYEQENNKPAKTTVMHAGLECGVLGAIYPNWDMASIGPTIRNPHSPDECVNIESVEVFWKWLLATLKKI